MESKMPMSQADITKEYREAKNKKQQIKILADENICKTGDIVRVLLAAGIPESELPKRPGPKPGQTKAKKKPEAGGDSSGQPEKKPLPEEPDPEEQTIIQKALKCYAGALQSRADKILEEIDRVNILLKKQEKENGSKPQ